MENSGVIMTPDFSTKDALKALGIVLTLLDESDPQDRISLTVISRKQPEFRKKKAGEFHQTTIHSYLKK